MERQKGDTKNQFENEKENGNGYLGPFDYNNGK